MLTPRHVDQLIFWLGIVLMYAGLKWAGFNFGQIILVILGIVCWRMIDWDNLT